MSKFKSKVIARALMAASVIALVPACTESGPAEMTIGEDGIPQGTGIFATESTLPFRAPDFDAIQDSDYLPAMEQGIAIQLAEMELIANNPEEATFDNTIVAMERTGRMLTRAYYPFSQEVGANTNDVLDAADSAISPQMAVLNDTIYLNAALFGRVKAVYDNRAAMTMTPEDAMLLDGVYADFVHSGAMLDDTAKDELRTINSRISELETEFSQKLTAATSDAAITVETVEELVGLTEGQIEAAAATAEERGVAAGQYVLTIQNTTQQPLLTSLDNREVRERLYNASINRTSSGGENDTTGVIREIVQLRTRKAELFDMPDYASWQMYDRFLEEPSRALEFMRQMVPALSETQLREAGVLNERIAEDGLDFTVQPWDWAYYADKIRQERYNLDANEIKQYFVVENVLEDGVFFMANQLYGLTFEKRDDIPVYHPDVTVYTVLEEDGSELALFYFDPFQRDNKQGGAWMSNFVEQSHLFGEMPVITNTQNVAIPADGQPALATFDDVNTMFHEFGHALHGMFADQQYTSLSGTNTARDWVEFPSQFHENFATLPAVLNNYAKHWETGETIPAETIASIDRAGKFDQGYALGETLTAALLDMEWHALAAGEAPDDVMAFEAEALGRLGLNADLVPPRYRTPYFRHIFSHSYEAGYYSYLWTEALHHDGYAWVVENGGMTREVGDHIRATFLGQGHSKSYSQMYLDFTGHEPRVEPMLIARGLLEG